MTAHTERTIDVLVVDDSALTRQLLTQILTRAQGFQVRAASDPLLALERMKQRRPDVVVLDLEMPRMKGMEFLRKIMAEDPLPVVICSAFAPKGTEEALLALEEGAVNVFSKPQFGLSEYFEEFAADFVEMMRGAAAAELTHRPLLVREPRWTASAILPPPPGSSPALGRPGALIVVGASTGGTDAIRAMLGAMPPHAPPIAIVQHMAPEFVAPFANRLGGACPMSVRVAGAGDRLERGTAYIAPGGRHLVVARRADRYFADVVDGPRVARHRPSVDVLFRSAATAAGSRAVGVLLTGMGDDGAAGLVELRKAGAHTIAQDEATCVVFGMPKEAIAREAAAEVAPLGRIAVLALQAARLRG